MTLFTGQKLPIDEICMSISFSLFTFSTLNSKWTTTYYSRGGSKCVEPSLGSTHPYTIVLRRECITIKVVAIICTELYYIPTAEHHSGFCQYHGTIFLHTVRPTFSLHPGQGIGSFFFTPSHYWALSPDDLFRKGFVVPKRGRTGMSELFRVAIVLTIMEFM